MSPPRDRAANRSNRRKAKGRNDEPLLRLVETEIRRKPVRARAQEVKPLTKAQAAYDHSISANTITFSNGPAGTGKTWWAAMRAATALRDGLVERIIITRPAVEAGESLGFLPGEMGEKFEPYFRPVREALAEFLGSGPLEYHLKAGTIVAAPLAFLRGSTFKNAFVLLDEAQNTSPVQMKMFLTRIGENSKMVIDGDLGQKDIEGMSGLEDAIRRLKGVPDMGFVEFTRDDIVRHGIVRTILDRYDDKPRPVSFGDRPAIFNCG